MTRTFVVPLLTGVILITSAEGSGPPAGPPFGAPIPGLSATELFRFQFGKAQFVTHETIASGLGPIFCAKSCESCHSGPAVGSGSSLTATFIASFDGPAELHCASGVGADCATIIPPEADVLAPRITPPLFGSGLVEAIPDAAIAANADPNDADGDGISGRVQLVQPLEDPTGPLRVGRFGTKAQIATILSFSAMAYRDFIGITNRLLPEEAFPDLPPECDPVPDPEDYEVLQRLEKIDVVSDFQRLLAPPPQWPPQGTMPGEAIFNTIGCAACHTPTWTTGPTAAFPALANQVLFPYSDFLVHDIGTGDGVTMSGATGSEIRTPALWGLRRRSDLLHNGCYVQSGGTFGFQGFEPAILVHGCQPVSNCTITHSGGECEALDAYNAYVALTPAEKTQVLQFLGSLGRILFSAAALTWPGDDDIDLNEDYFMMYLCIDNGGPGVDAQAVNPGVDELYDCRLGFDSDLDGDTDLADLADFQVLFTGER